MRRRLVISALACCPAVRLLADDDARPRRSISAETLYHALSARFPVRIGIAGVLEVQVNASRLLLVPARNRLGAALQVQVGGPQMRPTPPGEIDVVFGLRYEAADQTVRAHDLQIADVRWPGLAPDAMQTVQALLPALSANVGEVVLHKFSPRDLALADTMGFEPQEIRVTDEGLLIFFGPKPLR